MAGFHGPNLGHGYVKYIVLTSDGEELPPVVFPAALAPAGRTVAGALTSVPAIDIAGTRYWTGDDAHYSAAPITMPSQARLSDPIFIPALLRGALARLGALNGAATGVCVTGLPASWAADEGRCRRLGDLLRAATERYTSVRVIPEPLGLVYSVLLDNRGELVADEPYQGQVAVIDIGHLTVDVAVLRSLRPVPGSLATWQIGTVHPLGAIRSRLSATFDRELSIHEADQAVRSRGLIVGGTWRDLPPHWDAPIVDTGRQIADRLVESWQGGAQFDAILIGGGGAALEPLVHAIQGRFAHAQPVPDPQLAIARGYARLAARLARQ